MRHARPLSNACHGDDPRGVSAASRRAAAAGAFAVWVGALFPSIAIAQSPSQTTRAVAVHGDVQTVGQTNAPTRAGDLLEPGTRWVTRAGATLTAVSSDGTRVQLGPETELSRAPRTDAQRHGPPTPAWTLVRGSLIMSRELNTRVRRSLQIAAPSAILLFSHGEAIVHVHPREGLGLTVLRGLAWLRVGGHDAIIPSRRVVLMEVGSRQTRIAAMPSPPQWLREPPGGVVWTPERSSATADLRPPEPATPAPRLRVQLARDAAFQDVSDDRTVPSAEHVSWSLPQAGEYFVRAAWIHRGVVSSSWTVPVRVLAVGPTIVPAASGQVARLRVPAGLYCSLDRAALQTDRTLNLLPGYRHVARCSTDASGAGAVDFPIGAEVSGPIVATVVVQSALRSNAAAPRMVTIRLHDGGGRPMQLANVRLLTPPTVGVSAVQEADLPGLYTTSIIVRGVDGPFSVRLVVNDIVVQDVRVDAAPPR